MEQQSSLHSVTEIEIMLLLLFLYSTACVCGARNVMRLIKQLQKFYVHKTMIENQKS